MKCNICGTRVEDGLSTCPACGSEIEVSSVVTLEKNQNENPAEKGTESVSENSSNETTGKIIDEKIKNRLAKCLSVLSVISVIVTVALGVFLGLVKNEIKEISFDLKNEKDKQKELNDEIPLRELELEIDEKTLEEWNEKYIALQGEYKRACEAPVHIVVNDVYSAAGSKYDPKLTCSEITYLSTDFDSFYGSNVSKSGMLSIKYLNPDGSLRTGDVSKDGFSFFGKVSDSYCGWGWEDVGHYTMRGEYVIEYWYNNACVGRKRVYVD